MKAERARELRGLMTRAERLLWAALRADHLNGMHFRRQQVIDGFIVDFYCSTAGLVIEVDGPAHALHPHYDTERDHILSARGLRILRVSNDDVLHHLTVTLQRIASACDTKSIPVRVDQAPAIGPNAVEPASLPGSTATDAIAAAVHE
jgi:very-short-patch-repair endonuclease